MCISFSQVREFGTLKGRPDSARESEGLITCVVCSVGLKALVDSYLFGSFTLEEFNDSLKVRIRRCCCCCC